VKDVTVVIPTFQRPEPLDRCLAGVRAMSRTPWEVLAILRPDDLEGRTVARRWGARIVDVAEPGHLPPLRSALLGCRTEVMAVLDDDAVPRPDWLARVERHFSLPQVVCVTGAVRQHPAAGIASSSGGFGPSSVRALVRRKGRTWYAGLASLPTDLDCAVAGLAESVEVAHLQGGNCAYLCSALRRTGIDMSLNRGAAIGYEADLAMGLRRYGRVMFDPLMVVDHYPAARHGAPGRHDRLAYMQDYSHNLFHIEAKHFSFGERLRFSIYMTLVGQRLSPGLARAREVARLEGVSAGHVLAVTLAARRAGLLSGRKCLAQRSARPGVRSVDDATNAPAGRRG
jgi:GT2 family glycosyltransferase